jgi:hypothetical protein
VISSKVNRRRLKGANAGDTRVSPARQIVPFLSRGPNISSQGKVVLDRETGDDLLNSLRVYSFQDCNDYSCILHSAGTYHMRPDI